MRATNQCNYWERVNSVFSQLQCVNLFSDLIKTATLPIVFIPRNMYAYEGVRIFRTKGGKIGVVWSEVEENLGQVLGRQLFLSVLSGNCHRREDQGDHFCPFQTTLEPVATGRSFLRAGRAEQKPLKAGFKQTVWRGAQCVAFLFKCLCLPLCCSPEQCLIYLCKVR